MKGLIACMALSVVAILLGGFVACFPQFGPFAATLIITGAVGFVVFGVVALCRG